MYQTQPNSWSCTLTAFANALHIDNDTLIKELGHDGSRILWPTLPSPLNRTGFHPCEFYNSCLIRGFAPVMFERVLKTAPYASLPIHNVDNSIYFEKQVNELGVLFTQNHAFTLVDNTIIDPQKGIVEIPLDKFDIFIKFFKIENS